MEPMKVSKETMISEGEGKQLDISWGSGKIHKANSYRKQGNLLREKAYSALFHFHMIMCNN